MTIPNSPPASPDDTYERLHTLDVDEVRRKTEYVQKFIEQGTRNLKEGNLEKARLAFDVALKTSIFVPDEGHSERLCALKLGSVYIAMKNAKQGLRYLQKAVPPLHQRDGDSNGELFHYMAEGYEMLAAKNPHDKHLQRKVLANWSKALTEYKRDSATSEKIFSVAMKCAKLFSQAGRHEEAAGAYGDCAINCKEDEPGGREQKATMFLYRAQHLHQCGKTREALGTAERSLSALTACVNSLETVKILNGLAIVYSSCNSYDKAESSMEQAIDCFEQLYQDTSGNMKMEAALHQNNGAILNFVKKYERATKSLIKAQILNEQLGNTRNQCHCLINQGFSYFKLEMLKQSHSAYKRAEGLLQGPDDLHDRWQALEGMALVEYETNDLSAASEHLQEALRLNVLAREPTTECHTRLLRELENVKKAQLSRQLKGSVSPSESGSQTSRESIKPSQSRPLAQSPRLPRQDHSRNYRRPSENVINGKNHVIKTDIVRGLATYHPEFDESLAQYPASAGTKRNAPPVLTFEERARSVANVYGAPPMMAPQPLPPQQRKRYTVSEYSEDSEQQGEPLPSASDGDQQTDDSKTGLTDSSRSKRSSKRKQNRWKSIRNVTAASHLKETDTELDSDKEELLHHLRKQLKITGSDQSLKITMDLSPTKTPEPYDEAGPGGVDGPYNVSRPDGRVGPYDEVGRSLPPRLTQPPPKPVRQTASDKGEASARRSPLPTRERSQQVANRQRHDSFSSSCPSCSCTDTCSCSCCGSFSDASTVNQSKSNQGSTKEPMTSPGSYSSDDSSHSDSDTARHTSDSDDHIYAKIKHAGKGAISHSEPPPPPVRQPLLPGPSKSLEPIQEDSSSSITSSVHTPTTTSPTTGTGVNPDSPAAGRKDNSKDSKSCLIM